MMKLLYDMLNDRDIEIEELYFLKPDKESYTERKIKTFDDNFITLNFNMPITDGEEIGSIQLVLSKKSLINKLDQADKIILNSIKNKTYLTFSLIILFNSNLIFSSSSSANEGISDSLNTILAKVGNKIIYVNDFYRRAEYTIRPPYCKHDGNIDKKIIYK